MPNSNSLPNMNLSVWKKFEIYILYKLRLTVKSLSIKLIFHFFENVDFENTKQSCHHIPS